MRDAARTGRDAATCSRRRKRRDGESMAGDLTSLREARERVIAALSDRFAHDALELDEFDRRLTVAHRSSSVAELEHLLADLPEPIVPAAPIVPGVALAPASEVRARRTMAAVVGSARRTGPWTPPRRLRVVTVMGHAAVDFREARFAPGVTEVAITALLGSIEIVLPPGLAVDVDGVAIIGKFDHLERAPTEPDPERPLLRIEGTAVLSSVTVETRLPGESERDARRRRQNERVEQRALAAAESPALPPRAPRNES